MSAVAARGVAFVLVLIVAHSPDGSRLGVTLGRQWEVDSVGVLTRDRPSGLAVPRQVGERKRVTHERLLVDCARPTLRDVPSRALSWITVPPVSTAPIKD